MYKNTLEHMKNGHTALLPVWPSFGKNLIVDRMVHTLRFLFR
jgi:hypothetical protein